MRARVHLEGSEASCPPNSLRIQSRLAPARPGPASVRLAAVGHGTGREVGAPPPCGATARPTGRSPSPSPVPARPRPSPPSLARCCSAAARTYPAAGRGVSARSDGSRSLGRRGSAPGPPSGTGSGCGPPGSSPAPRHFLPVRPAPLPERPPSRLAPLRFPGSVPPSREASPRSPELGRVFVWELASLQFGARRAN